jgi:hypothetical protein
MSTQSTLPRRSAVNFQHSGADRRVLHSRRPQLSPVRGQVEAAIRSRRMNRRPLSKANVSRVLNA